jgi:hypothetical protein
MLDSLKNVPSYGHLLVKQFKIKVDKTDPDALRNILLIKNDSYCPPYINQGGNDPLIRSQIMENHIPTTTVEYQSINCITNGIVDLKTQITLSELKKVRLSIKISLIMSMKNLEKNHKIGNILFNKTKTAEANDNEMLC